MRRVLMKVTTADANGVYREGKPAMLPDTLASELVRCHAAVYVADLKDLPTGRVVVKAKPKKRRKRDEEE